MSRDDFHEIHDPIGRLERNQRQDTAAFRYVILAWLAVAALAGAMVFLFANVDQRCPDGLPLAGLSWLCLSGTRWEIVLLPTGLAVALAVTSAIKTYRRWQHHVRWRPWLFATYAMWIGATATLVGTSSVAFIRTTGTMAGSGLLG